jgi:glycosyltransferase involved in cell wall biosynthesis
MMQFTMHADLGLTLDKPLSKNYEFSLPNKLFDYMHAGTPILASKLVEIERVITTHQIGSILAEVSPDAISSAINELKSQPELLRKLEDACRKASEIENWENERLKLELLVRDVLTNYSL